MNPQIRTTILYIAAFCLLGGAVLQFADWFFAPYLFAMGAAGVAVTFLTTPVVDMDYRQKRLHRYTIFAGLLFVLASALMFAERKEWVLCVTIGALFLLYSSFAWPKEKED